MTFGEAVISNGGRFRQTQAHFSAWFGRLQIKLTERARDIVSVELVGAGKFKLNYVGRETLVRFEYFPTTTASTRAFIVAYAVDRLDAHSPTYTETFRCPIDALGNITVADANIAGSLQANEEVLLARILLGTVQGLDHF